MDFRESVVKNYPEVFTGTSSGASESGRIFGEKWGWYQHIHKLANGSVFEIGNATALHLGTALVFLAYDKDLNEEMIKGIKKR